jgi:hypothetical protein
MRAYARSNVERGDSSGVTPTSVDSIQFTNHPAPLAEEVERVRVTTNDPPEVGEFLRAQRLNIELCYLDGLAIEPRLAGSMTVATRVGIAGRVQRSAVTRRRWSTGPGPKVEGCVQARVKDWVFPRPGRDETTYVFTLTFAPRGFE